SASGKRKRGSYNSNTAHGADSRKLDCRLHCATCPSCSCTTSVGSPERSICAPFVTISSPSCSPPSTSSRPFSYESTLIGTSVATLESFESLQTAVRPASEVIALHGKTTTFTVSI